MKRNLKRQMKFVLCSLVAMPLIAAAGQASINRGIRLLKRGKADEATEMLSQAKNVDPALAQYNLGNAFYQNGEFIKANAAYENAQHATDAKLQQYAEYNAGNALLAELAENGSALATDKKVEAAKKATEHFKKAIQLNPSDRAAKQNYEQAKKIADQLEEQQKQEEEQEQENQDQDEDQEEQDENQDQENQDQENEDQQDPSEEEQDSEQEQDQQDQQDQENQENQEQPEQQPQPEPQPQEAEEMTEQEAQQVLDSMKQDEQDKRPTIMYGRPQRVEKDW